MSDTKECSGCKSSESGEFEPKIVMFCCNWCSYAGADGAGIARLQQPTNVRVVRVMCSSRIDPIHIYTAFLEGADGVLLTGCHIGDCHYVNGNDKTLVKYKFVKAALNELGIEDERLMLRWISASEGSQFAEFVREMVAKVKELGPSPLRKEGVI